MAKSHKHIKPPPSPANSYYSEHIKLLVTSLQTVSGIRLIEEELSQEEMAKRLFFAPFALVSHDSAKDPVFNYGNQTALRLFEMEWEEFISLPSRKSAEPLHREERKRLLEEVSQKGFISNYTGIRISAKGNRFLIKNAIVWNVIDEKGVYIGQAATFSEWEAL